MAMSNEELKHWADYGASLNPEDTSQGYVFGNDLVPIWHVLAAIAQRHLDGIPEPVEPEPPMDLV